MQEVAYESLTFEQRRELHAAVGRRLESTGGAGREALLAHHFVAAGEPRGGFRWSRAAAFAAMEAGADEEAVRHLTRAIELARAADAAGVDDDLLESTCRSGRRRSRDSAGARRPSPTIAAPSVSTRGCGATSRP